VIRWSDQALSNLEAIRDYIALENFDAGARQCQLILESIDLLSRFRMMAPETRHSGIRKLSVPGTPYLVFYRLLPDAVLLVRIIHGARRIPAYLLR
jgi:toxin ParE1/3/4